MRRFVVVLLTACLLNICLASANEAVTAGPDESKCSYDIDKLITHLYTHKVLANKKLKKKACIKIEQLKEKCYQHARLKKQFDEVLPLHCKGNLIPTGWISVTVPILIMLFFNTSI
ncbi:hypothetical protein O0L34_g10176 [Tuta absoluta]|nr:hypothetical protein O0L34_g10176 [Tuta absoluta]